MNKAEMREALNRAKSGEFLNVTEGDLHRFGGYGLPGFDRLIHCTVDEIARLIRWQALRFNGTWDMAEVDAIAAVGRDHFRIIG